MPKRKRDGRVVGQSGPPEEDRQRADLERQIQLGKRQLTRNLKLAKGFERQKLGRREKDARAKKDDKEIAKIEAEIQALKQVDIPTSAEHHLYKTLHKIKSIKSSGFLPDTIPFPPKATVDVATSNVTARMYNAKLVKDAMVNTLHAIRFAIGVGEGTESEQKHNKAGKKDDAPNKKKSATIETRPTIVPPRSPTFSSGSEDEDDNTEDSEEVTLPSESNDNDVDSEERNADDVFDSDAYAAFDARIASSSSEDDENDSSNGGRENSVAATLDLKFRGKLLVAAGKAAKDTTSTFVPASSSDEASVKFDSMEDEKYLKEHVMESSRPSERTYKDDTLNGTQAKRPAKTAAVATRMILSHLGIRKRGTLDPKVSTTGGLDTSAETEAPPAAPDKSIENPEDHASPTGTDDLEPALASKRVKTVLSKSAKSLDQSDEDDQMLGRKILPPPRLSRTARRAALRDSVQAQEDNASSESDAAIPIPVPVQNKINTSKEGTDRLKKEEKAAVKAQQSAKSTFLPSLADGAYWSGSESEPSDIEEHVAPRKNRRGQRARQAIAEKKHGKAAKHLQAEVKKKGRDDGWDLKRGATSGEDGWRKGKGSTWKGTDANGISGSNAIPVTAAPKKERKRTKDDEGPLHPSWEAKKNAKTKDVIVPFKGKKITFD